jgi:hypothetical protein
VRSDNPFAEFNQAVRDPDAAPAASQLQLPPGYIWALDSTTGAMVAVPVHEGVPAPAPAPEPAPRLSDFEKMLLFAKQQPEPLPEAPAPAPQGVPPVIAQGVVLGSIAMLSGGAAMWMLGAALHYAAPALPVLPEVLRWTLALIGGVVGAVVVLMMLASTRTRGDGTRITALVHSERHTHIGKQSGGFWKGQVNNKF